jgi:hypothetical protein
MTAENSYPDLIDKLADGISKLTSSEAWRDYLGFQVEQE